MQKIVTPNMNDTLFASSLESIAIAFKLTFASTLEGNKQLLSTGSFSDQNFEKRFDCARRGDACEQDGDCVLLKQDKDKTKYKVAARTIVENTYTDKFFNDRIKLSRTKRPTPYASRSDNQDTRRLADLVKRLLSWYENDKGVCAYVDDYTRFEIGGNISILGRFYKIVYAEESPLLSFSTSKCLGVIHDNELTIACRAFDMRANVKSYYGRVRRFLEKTRAKAAELNTSYRILCDSTMLFGDKLEEALRQILAKNGTHPTIAVDSKIKEVCGSDIGIRSFSLDLSDQIFNIQKLRKILSENGDIKYINFAGFSQGGPTAHVLAFLFCVLVLPDLSNIDVRFTTMGAPRVGNKTFCKLMSQLCPNGKNFTLALAVDGDYIVDPAATAPRQTKALKDKQRLYNVEPNYLLINNMEMYGKPNQMIREGVFEILAKRVFSVDCSTHIGMGVAGYIPNSVSDDPVQHIRALIHQFNRGERSNSAGASEKDFKWWGELHDQTAYIATLFQKNIAWSEEDLESFEAFL